MVSRELVGKLSVPFAWTGKSGERERDERDERARAEREGEAVASSPGSFVCRRKI